MSEQTPIPSSASSTPTEPTVLRRSIFRSIGNSLIVLVPAVVVLLALISITLLALGKDPVGAAGQFIKAALGTPASRADVIMAGLPMLLCASGLLVTFTAGLWNIGIEGQMTMGALFATIIAINVTPDMNPLVVIPLELAMGMLGGALWAAVAGLLKTRGNINEIFAGVALNFIASNIVLSLINGPWREGNVPQTKVFAAPALLPRVESLRLSYVAIAIAITAFFIIFFVLRGTRWGLQLRAMGKSVRSAFVLGVRTDRNTMWSMMLCGMLAGIAGSFQALFTYQKLIPNISSGVGFLGVLIVLLVNVQPTWVPLVTLFFAIVPVGNLKLAAALNDAVRLETSLGNVFQSGLVLLVLLFSGIRQRLQRKED